MKIFGAMAICGMVGAALLTAPPAQACVASGGCYVHVGFAWSNGAKVPLNAAHPVLNFDGRADMAQYEVSIVDSKGVIVPSTVGPYPIHYLGGLAGPFVTRAKVDPLSPLTVGETYTVKLRVGPDRCPLEGKPSDAGADSDASEGDASDAGAADAGAVAEQTLSFQVTAAAPVPTSLGTVTANGGSVSADAPGLAPFADITIFEASVDNAWKQSKTPAFTFRCGSSEGHCDPAVSSAGSHRVNLSAQIVGLEGVSVGGGDPPAFLNFPTCGYAPGSPDSGTNDGGAGSGGAGSGGAASATPGDADAGGCGCTTSPTKPSLLGWGFFLAVGALASRFARRRR